MRAYRFALVPLAAALLLSACTEDTTGPDVGSGNELEATVNGQNLVLNLTPGASTYDSRTKQVFITGTLVGTPSKTVLLRFNYDIEQGPFPGTISGSSVNIVYTEGESLMYDCPLPDNTCTITVTRSNGEIVDGTFSAMLMERTDTTKKVTITNGQFSVDLTR